MLGLSRLASYPGRAAAHVLFGICEVKLMIVRNVPHQRHETAIKMPYITLVMPAIRGSKRQLKVIAVVLIRPYLSMPRPSTTHSESTGVVA